MEHVKEEEYSDNLFNYLVWEYNELDKCVFIYNKKNHNNLTQVENLRDLALCDKTTYIFL